MLQADLGQPKRDQRSWTMPSNSQPAKASKWSVGSFLQQAVAGVESRLDTILAENDDDETVNEGNKQEKQTEQSSQWAGKQPEKLPSASKYVV